MWDRRLGKIQATEHRIELKLGIDIIHQNPYRAGHKEREFSQKEINNMIDADIISPSDSEWASPVILALKSEGSLSFCIDYRRLKAVTKFDSYPLPRMDDCMDIIGEANIFTALDANLGYWQLPVRESDQVKTAFSCHDGIFEFNQMPFWLMSACPFSEGARRDPLSI